MTADLKLLEMAAKAAGYDDMQWVDGFGGFSVGQCLLAWNPPKVREQAFDLAAVLHFRLDFNAGTVHHRNGTLLAVGGDMCLAITEAAAKIGRSMK